MNRNKALVKKIFSSIRTKFLVSFSLVIIISVAFVTYFPITTYSKRLEENSTKYSNQVITNYISNIDNYIEELDRVTDSIIYNFYIQRYLIDYASSEATTDDEPKTPNSSSSYYQASMDTLSNIINLRSDINSVFISNTEDIALYKSRLKNIKLDTLYNRIQSQENILNNTGKAILYDIYDIDYYEKPFTGFTLSRTLERYDGLGDLGLIYIDTNLSVYKKLGDSAVLDDNTMLILIDEFGHFIYHTSLTTKLKETVFRNKELLANNINTHAKDSITHDVYIETLYDEDYQIVFKKAEKTGWLIATVTPRNSILSEVIEVRNSIILISLFSLIIILPITFLITTRITNPIKNLKSSMDKAVHNQFNSMVEVNTNDEIGDLSSSFNEMISRIKSLMDELVTEQEEKRNAEIKVLQDQINPHFLYNTLDTIIWMTETDDPNTVPMIEALSKLFRISLSKGQEFITIEEELEHIKNYLYILKLRYLDKFDYDINVSKSLLKYRIPKIILQPLIENAIYHGIKNITEKGHIQINGIATLDTIVLSITDNGIGMDHETCSKLLANQPTDIKTSGSGVGIRNVNQRIKLYYGQDYGLKYESTQGSGTTVTITLPL